MCRQNIDENTVAFRFLAQANDISEWLYALYCIYIFGTLIGLSVVSLLSALYCSMIRGDGNAVHFYRPGKLL